MAIVESIFVTALQTLTVRKLWITRKNKVTALQSKAVSHMATSQVTRAGTTTQVRIKISAKVEYKMVISILCMGIVMTMKIIFYTWYLVTDSIESLELFIFVTDIFSLLSPFLLLSFSEFTRKMLADFVIRRQTYSI